MGLTKQYLAYRAVGNCGVIASNRSNVSFVTLHGKEGRYVATGAAENVIIWDLRLGTQEFILKRENEEVTALRASPDNIHLAVGYIDGVIELFNLETIESVCSFALHKSAVSVLRFDSIGMRLASGGNDTDLVVCDIVAQRGLSRLKGHTGNITDTHFLELDNNILVSCSKDTRIKFWNLDTQFCFKTLVDHRSEVWGMAFLKNYSFLVSGSNDTTLNVYKITKNDIIQTEVIPLIDNSESLDSDMNSPINCKFVGTIHRTGNGRTVGLCSDPTGNILGCFGVYENIDFFYFFNDNESSARLAKRMKKLRIKNSKAEKTELEVNENEQNNNATVLSLVDEIRRLNSIKIPNKLKSMDLLMGLNNELRITVTLDNNSIKLYSMIVPEKSQEATLIRTLHLQGHRDELRSICFSSDSESFISGAGDGIKLWNVESLACLRTIKTDYVISTCFVPGDRHAILGLKNGSLTIVDIITGDILETIPAHENELWSICLLPDLRGCVTGGGDDTVKMWTFELIDDLQDGIEQNKGKVLSLLHQNTLKVDENVMCVKVSQNNKFLAVALFDSTVKIFFLDTFKFYLSLYGHKLPVLCMDISYDSSIIITGSADRNIKIWGMDFGDCHRSLFAHDDSIMQLQFLPKTHMFFSCGRDGKIKQWDADIAQKILTLPGHFGEARGLAVSPNGYYVATCGSDKTIRVFEKTEEIVVLADTQEEEREEIENKKLATGEDSTISGLPGLRLPSKKTIGAEKATESILECLEIIKKYENDDDDRDIKNMMTAYEVGNTIDFITVVLMRIRASDLEEALLILPFSAVCSLLERIPELIEKRKDQTELLCKIVFFLFRIHQRPIVNNVSLLPIIRELIPKVHEILTEIRDLVGINFHGLQLLQKELESRNGYELFREAAKMKKQKDKKYKKRQLTKRLHIQMMG